MNESQEFIPVSIYALICPNTFKIRYIGRTINDLNIRLNGHYSKCLKSNSHKNCWIRSLRINNKKPIIKYYKTIIGWENSHKYERELIGRCLDFGMNLVNSDDLGPGKYNKVITKKQRINISKTLKKGYKSGRIIPTNKTKVSAFDLEGKFIKSYESVKSCCENLKLKVSSVEKVLSKKVKRIKKYQITYGAPPGKYKKRVDYSQNNKQVFIKSLSNQKITEFKNYKSLAKFLGVTTPTIRRNINKVYKEYYIYNKELK